MEKVIQNLNFHNYPFIEEVKLLCVSKTMVSALLFLSTKNKQENNGQQELGCMQVL